MRRPSTLKSKINGLTAISAIAAIMIVALMLSAHFYVKNSTVRTSTANALLHSAAQDLKALPPLFLLEEQRAGVPLTLERIKQRERLSFIETYELESDIPTQFKSCPFLDSPQICEQASDDNVVISAAITDGNKAIAFLIETKDLGGLASDQILLIIEVVIVLASALFIFLFVGVSKITSVEVPAALADLIEWIKSDSVERPNLKFSEFNILADQIAKVVLERQRINSQVIFPPFVGHD